MARGIVVRIHPTHARELRELWTEMRKLDILPAETINEALYSELQNIGLRWGDAINEAIDEQLKKKSD